GDREPGRVGDESFVDEAVEHGRGQLLGDVGEAALLQGQGRPRAARRVVVQDPNDELAGTDRRAVDRLGETPLLGIAQQAWCGNRAEHDRAEQHHDGRPDGDLRSPAHPDECPPRPECTPHVVSPIRSSSAVRCRRRRREVTTGSAIPAVTAIATTTPSVPHGITRRGDGIALVPSRMTPRLGSASRASAMPDTSPATAENPTRGTVSRTSHRRSSDARVPNARSTANAGRRSRPPTTAVRTSPIEATTSDAASASARLPESPTVTGSRLIVRAS